MNASNIRLKLQKYVETGDENLLKLIYAVAKEYEQIDKEDYSFTKEDILLFEERRAKRLSGESAIYSWEDAKTIVKGKKTA